MAAIYTLTETKLNGLDPEDDLRKVLARIADHPVGRVHKPVPREVAEITLRLDRRKPPERTLSQLRPRDRPSPQPNAVARSVRSLAAASNGTKQNTPLNALWNVEKHSTECP